MLKNLNGGSVRNRAVAVILLCGMVLSAQPAIAGDLYDLESTREAALYSFGLIGGLATWQVSEGQQPLTAAEIAAVDVADVGGFDRIATHKWSPTADTFSDILAYAMVATPALLYTETGAGMSGGDLTVMYTQTLLLQQVTTGLIKGAVGRKRPFVYNRDPRIPDEYRQSKTAVRSFPSGHTATAFAGAVFTGEVFARLNPNDPARHWVRGVTLGLAALTGWLRIEAGKHFPTDVLAGAVLGSLVGWGVPKLHEIDPAPEGQPAKAAPGLAFAFRF